MPEVPVEQPATWRTGYAERDPIPDTAVTRQLAASVHDRPHRLKQLRVLMERPRDRALGRRGRDIPRLGRFAGEQLARWALSEVLFTEKRPVPSYGFELAPVLTHCVAARRQWRLRAAVLVTVVVATGVRYPFGVAGIAVVALLHMWLRGGKVGRILKWGTTSIVSFVLLGLVVLAAYQLAGTYAPLLRQSLRQGERAALLLALAVTAVYLLDRWVAWGYVIAVRQEREKVGSTPLAAPLAAKKIKAAEVTETWQTIAYRSNWSSYGFVGAGHMTWPKGQSRIQLKAAGGDDEDDGSGRQHHELDGLRDFEADDLMDEVRDELERLRGVLIETHSLPNCDVSEMYGVPESEWKKLPTAPAERWPEADEMIRGARGAPSSVSGRRYLAAQVVSWEGQIVVTVFAHAALEGRTLHFITRPHIMTPLLKETAVGARRGWALAGDLLLVPLHAVGDAVDLAHRSYQVVRRSLGLLKNRDGGGPARFDDDGGKPVSLREYCSQPSVEDMHQWEDVLRHASILQTWMFARVRVFLHEHGAELGEFDKQMAAVINQTVVIGNDNKVMTSSAGGDSSQRQDGAEKAAAGPAEPSKKE
ncbi:hypothetical protein [Streptomyces lutosisoli]|uniref:Integral membrane protein n=1 Tax=Streptomyces lutosisoli TaxID=2665721 RepID=A0ABW2VN15_9ACTN